MQQARDGGGQLLFRLTPESTLKVCGCKVTTCDKEYELIQRLRTEGDNNNCL